MLNVIMEFQSFVNSGDFWQLSVFLIAWYLFIDTTLIVADLIEGTISYWHSLAPCIAPLPKRRRSKILFFILKNAQSFKLINDLLLLSGEFGSLRKSLRINMDRHRLVLVAVPYMIISKIVLITRKFCSIFTHNFWFLGQRH